MRYEFDIKRVYGASVVVNSCGTAYSRATNDAKFNVSVLDITDNNEIIQEELDPVTEDQFIDIIMEMMESAKDPECEDHISISINSIDIIDNFNAN